MLRTKKISVSDDNFTKALDKINSKIHFPLLKASFALLLLSARGNGKTTLLINMLLQGYKGVFHNVWIFSPTLNSDPKWKAIKVDDEKKFECYDDEYLQSIIDFQDLEENKNKFGLIIFDDCIGMFSRNSLVNSFLTKARWHRLSLIFSLQYTKHLSPMMRANMTSVIVLGNTVKKEELKKIDDILDPNFEKYYKQLKKKGVSRYNFILNNFEADPQIMFNWNNKIILDDGTEIEPEIINT